MVKAITNSSEVIAKSIQKVLQISFVAEGAFSPCSVCSAILLSFKEVLSN
ncbi:hypothetical protein [Emticicia sp. SJ17W-69]